MMCKLSVARVFNFFNFHKSVSRQLLLFLVKRTTWQEFKHRWCWFHSTLANFNTRKTSHNLFPNKKKNWDGFLLLKYYKYYDYLKDGHSEQIPVLKVLIFYRFTISMVTTFDIFKVKELADIGDALEIAF